MKNGGGIGEQTDREYLGVGTFTLPIFPVLVIFFSFRFLSFQYTIIPTHVITGSCSVSLGSERFLYGSEMTDLSFPQIYHRLSSFS